MSGLLPEHLQMKSNFKVPLAFTVGLMALSACNTDDDDDNIPELPHLSTLPVTEITPKLC